MIAIKNRFVTLLSLLLACILLCGLTACNDDANDKNSGTTNVTEVVTDDPGEPFDPNNQYAKDNNAYYKDSWSK